MSHLIFTLYTVFASLYINCLFQLHTFCTPGWQSVTINGTKNLNQRCVVWCSVTETCTEHWTLSIKHVLETVSKMLCYNETRWWAVSSVSVSSVAHDDTKLLWPFHASAMFSSSVLEPKQQKTATEKTTKYIIQKVMTTHNTILENLNSFLTSRGILCLVWNLNVGGR